MEHYPLILTETSQTRAERFSLLPQNSKLVIPVARRRPCPEPVGPQGPVNRLIQFWAQAPEAGQAERKQLRQWKPTREKAVDSRLHGCVTWAVTHDPLLRSIPNLV